MFEVADIIRRHGTALRASLGGRLLPSQARAWRDLVACRTAACGGQLTQCTACGGQVYRYHSCRNRHCPKCGGDQTARWLERHRARLIPAAFRTMPVAAGVIPIHLPAARRALRELAATGRRPTRHEVAQRARLTREQPTPEARAQGGPMAADDVRHLQHDALCTRSEVVHQLVERIGQRGANLAREMRVDLRRPRTPMAERVLDDPQVDAGLQ